MKTAISLPDELFDEADAVAYRTGVSRSQLYATALAEYLAKFREQDMTARLNTVYTADSPKRDSALRESARQTLRRSEW